MAHRLAPVLLCLGTLAFASPQADVPWSVGAKSPRIEALRRRVESGDRAAVAQFWTELAASHTPLVEPNPIDPQQRLVTFVYRGSSDTTAVVLYTQMIVGRDPSVNRLTRLGATDVWFKTYSVRDDMRLAYSFMPNPTDASLNSADAGVADSLNPIAAPRAAYMGKSVLELPNAPALPWVAPRANVRAGKIEELRVQSKILNATRAAWVYTPDAFDSARPDPYPVLICFDGQLYSSADYMPVPTIVENMIADKKIPPLVVLLIAQSPQPNRNIELSNNQAFLDFVADELLPQVRRGWHVTADPRQTIVTGSSTGGLASAFFAFRRPDVFGNVLAQSGAFWPGKVRDDPDREWLTQQYEASPPLPIRFVLQVGLLERGSTPGGGPSILDANRRLRAVLERKGYELHYREIAGGHEPLNWRGGISEGLLQLIGSDPRKSDHRPVDAIAGIVAAFQQHPIVAIGEWRHGIRQLGDFYIKLVNDPRFREAAQDIVIEFASRNNQPLLDRYTNGGDVPLEEVQHIWRDTTKVASWESPIYSEWLAAIRDVNRRLPPTKRLRVLAGDTAIDWPRINSQDDWARLGDNNVSFADVIGNEVAKHRRALVVLGSNHLAKLGGRGAENTATMLERRYPGSLYVAIHHLIPHDPDEEILMLPDHPAAPALYDLAGTTLGSTPDRNGIAPERNVDAWLYVGPADSMTDARPPAGSLDDRYLKELDRRSMIEWGDLRVRRFFSAARD